MAVPLTQTVIPGGFTLENAQKLGFAVEPSDESSYKKQSFLVSYLAKEVCLLPELLPDQILKKRIPSVFENTYVVFFHDNLKDDSWNYKWEVELYDEQNAVPLQKFTYDTQATPPLPAPILQPLKDGILKLQLKKDQINDISIIKKIKVKCEATTTGKTLNFALEHTIIALNTRIEHFCRLPLADTKGSEKGEQELIRIIANNFLIFLKDLSFEESDVPANVIVAVLYNKMYAPYQKLIKELEKTNPNLSGFSFVNFDNDNIYKWLNFGTAIPNISDPDPQKADLNIGLCNISLLTASMILKDDMVLPTSCLIDRVNDDNLKRLLDKFIDLSVDANKKKCLCALYNLLKFPKSNINTCSIILNFLKCADYDDEKDPNAAWKTKKIEQTDWMAEKKTNQSRRIVENIVSELAQAFYKKVVPIKVNYGALIAKNVYSAFVTRLSNRWLSEPELQYKLENLDSKYRFNFTSIKIKVLDVRSGQPIPFARVKNLEIYTQNNRVSTSTSPQPVISLKSVSDRDKLYDSHQYITEGEPLRGAQLALSRMGFLAEDELGWDESSSAIINYCKSRRITKNTNPESSISKDDESFLKNTILHNYIFEEFNSHWCTDAEGVLSIRLPKKFIDGNNYLHAEVGFWDFPIIIEGDKIMAHETPTKFKIEWVGGQNKDNQCLIWNDSIDKNNKNFAWKVSNNMPVPPQIDFLKVCQKLVIKNSTIPLKQEFILFGMQFCPPVWDGVEDPDVDNVNLQTSERDWRSNRIVFLNKRNNKGDWVRDLGIHIVTIPIKGSQDHPERNPWGHYYGFNDEDSNGKYRKQEYRQRNGSVDLYSGKDGNIFCFAFNKGIVSYPANQKYGEISLKNYIKDAADLNPKSELPDHKRLRKSEAYLHNKYPDVNRLASGTIVMCGQIIGTTNRKGMPDYAPSHVHMQNNSNEWLGYLNYLYLSVGQIDEQFPSWINRLPLILPCKCHHDNVKYRVTCNFNDKKNFQPTCWAFREFPYGTTKDEYGIGEHGELYISSNNTPNDQQDMDPLGIIDKDGNKVFICPYVHRKIEPDLSSNAIIGATLININEFEEFPSNGYMLFYNLQPNGAYDKGEIFEIKSISNPTTTIELKKPISAQYNMGSAKLLYFSPQLIQAQLMFAFQRDKRINGDRYDNTPDPLRYRNPEKVNGALGVITEVTINGVTNDKVTVISADANLGFTKIQYKKGTIENEGWIADNLLRKEGSDVKLVQNIKNLINEPTKTRAAIYYFKVNAGPPIAGDGNVYNYLKIEEDGPSILALHKLMPENPCWRVPSI